MTREQWKKVKRLFRRAARIEDPVKREVFLNCANAEERPLLQEVKGLLAERAKTDEFLAVYSSMGGKRLSHYEILERIGEGGMALVYKARDTRLHRWVAIKVLPAWLMADLDSRQRLVGEARYASALNHPNIVTVHEIARVKGVDFMVMEYISGKTLDRVIPPHGLPVRQTLSYALQIAAALAHAHTAGITHRDLKPSNIMVTGDGLIKLLDFGLAAPIESSTKRASQNVGSGGRDHQGPMACRFGTLAYMAPEQLGHEVANPRADIFSFGLLLQEMLSGLRAVKTNPCQTAQAVLNRLSNDLAGRVSPRLARLLRRCLQKEPERRFQTMQDVLTALRRCSRASGWTHPWSQARFRKARGRSARL